MRFDAALNEHAGKIQELQAAGVSDQRIASLYPVDAANYTTKLAAAFSGSRFHGASGHLFPHFGNSEPVIYGLSRTVRLLDRTNAARPAKFTLEEELGNLSVNRELMQDLAQQLIDAHSITYSNPDEAIHWLSKVCSIPELLIAIRDIPRLKIKDKSARSLFNQEVDIRAFLSGVGQLLDVAP